MRAVDLHFVRFDFDLTLAIVLMHPDGTVYHRYGSRDAHDATSWMSLPSLVRLLDATLEDHRDHLRAPAPPPRREPMRAIDLPVLARRIAAGQKADCIHCHTVHDMEHRHAVELGRWSDDDKWLHPDPTRIGLHLDSDDQALVRGVVPDGAAAAAGLLAGDRLVSFGDQRRVRTVADVTWELHRLPAGAAEVGITFARGGELLQAALRMAAGWKECTPREYAWRPFQWNLSPAPGFGGPQLGAGELARLGLPAGSFAFRVQYVVDWGERAHRGRAAVRAGIRKGDVVVSFAGRSDFDSVAHFHAWVRLTRTVGEEVEVVLLRDGGRRTVRYALPE